MAHSTISTADAPSTPQSDALARLTLETAKYLDVGAGQTISVPEVREQAQAEGYTSKEFREMLANDGLTGARRLRVPRQGDLFGELWPSRRAPTATDDTHPNLEDFREWLANKRVKRRYESDDGETYQHPVEHAYSHKSERKKYAMAKDVGRHFVESHEGFTTVLVTYHRPRASDESVSAHAARYYPEALKKRRERLLKRHNVYEKGAGVSLLAPRKPDEQAPTPTGDTHAHDFFWLPGFVDREAFDSLESYEEFDVDVSVRYHLSEQVESPTQVREPERRGSTTALPQEVGANLPVLTATNSGNYDSPERWAALDASECPEYVEEWCAHLSCGEDGETSSNGLKRWRAVAKFNEYAKQQRATRKLRDAHASARVLAGLIQH